MPIAVNPNTGETVYLTEGGTWEKAQIAVNPETKERLAFDGKDWTPVKVSSSIGGYAKAAATGAMQGATANFADEILGMLAAGGSSLPRAMTSGGSPIIGMGSAGIQGLGRLGYDYLTGSDTGTSKYEAARDQFRQQVKQSEEQYPLTSLAGNVGGAVAVPGAGLLKGATMAGRAGNAAITGGLYGALSGAGEGENLADRATKSVTGGVLGAAVGGAAAPAVEKLLAGGSKLLNYPVNLVRSAISPEAQANKTIDKAYAAAQRTDPTAINRLNANEVGGPATVMDTLGQEGRNLARSSRNLSGEADDILTRELDPRFEEQAPRLVGWLRNTFHFPDAHAQQEALDAANKTVTGRTYTVARQAGDREIWSPELERLTGVPEVVDAMKAAAAKSKGRGILEGGGGMNPGVTVDNGGIVTFAKKPSGIPTYPNLQFWDYTRRELSNEASKAQRAGDKEGVSYFGGLAKLMNSELDNLVPQYAQARSTAASFFKADNALEAGQKFVTENFAIPETRAALSKMTPDERKLFQDGFVSRFMETISKIPDRADVTRRVFQSQEARDKFVLALGDKRAKEFEAALRVENIMQKSLTAVKGNSSTALQLASIGLAGAGGGYSLDVNPTISGFATMLTAAGKKGLDAKVAVEVAKRLMSNDPATLKNAVAMAARNPRIMDALRAADNAAARAGAGQTINVPALQAAGIGRADENQQ